MSEGGGGGFIGSLAEAIPLVIAVLLVVAEVLVLILAMVLAIVIYPFISTLVGWMVELVNNTLIPVAVWGISLNPDVSAFQVLTDDLIKILSGCYIIAVLLTGLYIIFISTSPEKRARAKTMLLRLLLGMALITSSLQIYEVLLSISGALTKKMLANAALTASGGAISGGEVLVATQLAWAWVIPIVLILAIVAIGLRFVLVSVMAVIFPITLFLYFFELTRGIGSNLIRYTIMAIITQPVMALMLMITLGALNSVSLEDGNIVAQLMSVFIGMAGFMGIAAAPLITMGIMKWVGGAAAGYGMYLSFTNPRLGGAMVAAGGLAAGMGPEALVVGYSAKALGTHSLHTRVESGIIKKQMQEEYTRTGKLTTSWDTFQHNAHHMMAESDHMGQWKHVPKRLRVGSGARYRHWSGDTFDFEEKMLHKEMHVKGLHEYHEAESMIPYPLQTVHNKVGGLGSKISKKLRGTSLYTNKAREEQMLTARKQLAAIDAAEKPGEVGALLNDALVEMQVSTTDNKLTPEEINRLSDMVARETDPIKAKDMAKGSIVYSRLKQDKFADLDHDFFGNIERELRKGNAGIMSKEEFTKELKGYYADKYSFEEGEIHKRRDGIRERWQTDFEQQRQNILENYPPEEAKARIKELEDRTSIQMGEELHKDDKQHAKADRIRLEKIEEQESKAIDQYVNDYDHYHKAYGQERAEVFAAANAYQHEAANQLHEIPPEVMAEYERNMSDDAAFAFRMDLGSNLHARMLLEDYMGIGPRPSEFYHGIGPESASEWEKQQAQTDKITKNDKDTWERI